MNSAKRRGEVWLVNLDPTIGQEIQKTRPIVIISSDLFEPMVESRWSINSSPSQLELYVRLSSHTAPELLGD